MAVHMEFKKKHFAQNHVTMLGQRLHNYISDVCTRMEWKLNLINKQTQDITG